MLWVWPKKDRKKKREREREKREKVGVEKGWLLWGVDVQREKETEKRRAREEGSNHALEVV